MPITVSNLNCTYDKGLPTERVALRGVSFEVKSGEIVSVLGHTGSGKSTLAQHLNALVTEEKGAVAVDGLDACVARNAREIRRKVGLVFQYPEEQIFSETVSDEIAFAPRNWGFSEKEIELIAEDVAAKVGLDKKILAAPAFGISGGQKRRVAIASVIAARPSYLVLDEPTAGLDGSAVRELTETLRAFAKDGMGIVHITHDIELALEISSKIIVLEEGSVVASGTPAETAEFLAGRSVKGLMTPETLRVARRLKEAGKIEKLVWKPEELAALLIEKARAREE